MNIFIINGSGGVGKDTFVEYCKNIIGEKYVYIFSTIDPIKEIAYLIGWDGIKDEKSRKFLSELKKIINEYNNYSFNYIKKEIEKVNLLINQFYLQDENFIIFIHCREIEEIKKYVNDFNAKTILIINKNINKINTNNSDKNVYNYNYDYIIDNSFSKEELYDKAKYFCNKIKEEK